MLRKSAAGCGGAGALSADNDCLSPSTSAAGQLAGWRLARSSSITITATSPGVRCESRVRASSAAWATCHLTLVPQIPPACCDRVSLLLNNRR